MGPRAEFEAEHPDVHVLSADQAGRVDLVMGALGWLGDEEQVTTCADLGGESSAVMRVELQELRGGWRTAVLKQSLPWVSASESIAMPADRARAELWFYRCVARLPDAAGRLPRLLGGDEGRRLLLLEDFRGARALTSLYRGEALDERAARALGAFLEALHRATRDGQAPEFANAGMRTLNHRMVFDAPLSAPAAACDGFGPDGPAPGRGVLEGIEPGLGAAASAMRADHALREAVDDLGRRYLDGGPCLVHGAFHPGNWLLLPAGGVRVVNPQYGSWGDAEFDVGVGLAHLLLARQSDEIVKAFVTAATGAGGAPEVADAADSAEELAPGGEETAACGQRPGAEASGPDAADRYLFDRELTARYAGVEMIRRLIGGGQLPLEADAGVRCALLEAARAAIVTGRLEVLQT